MAGHGSLGQPHFAKDPAAPFILIVQDAHDVEDAQRHIAGMIDALGAGDRTVLVGVEGAWGPFRLEGYRAYPDKDVTRGIAEALLARATIGGPEFAGLTMERAPLLWGVEDPAAYRANVDALLEARAEKATLETFLARAREAAGALKARIYSPELLAFDGRAAAYAARTEGLGEHVKYLMSVPAPGEFPNLSLFLKVLRREERLDFAALEKDRRSLAEALSTGLPRAALDDLMRRSLDLRAGRISCADYYRRLREAAARHGMPLAAFGRLEEYVLYLEEAERIHRGRLLDELDRRERAVEAALIRTPEQKRLAAVSRRLALLGKLSALALTPGEWAVYQRERDASPAPADEVRALGGGELPPVPSLAPFEDFCRLALARNGAMAENLLRKAREEKAPFAVLVAGGFHSDGLGAALTAKGASWAVATPSIERIPEGHDYLEAFTRGPRPLEKILTGEPIAVKYPPALAAGTTTAEARFAPVFAAAVQEMLADAPEALAGALHPDLASLKRSVTERGGFSVSVFKADVKGHPFTFEAVASTGEKIAVLKRWFSGRDDVEIVEFPVRGTPYALALIRTQTANQAVREKLGKALKAASFLAVVWREKFALFHPLFVPRHGYGTLRENAQVAALQLAGWGIFLLPLAAAYRWGWPAAIPSGVAAWAALGVSSFLAVQGIHWGSLKVGVPRGWAPGTLGRAAGEEALPAAVVNQLFGTHFPPGSVRFIQKGAPDPRGERLCQAVYEARRPGPIPEIDRRTFLFLMTPGWPDSARLISTAPRGFDLVRDVFPFLSQTDVVHRGFDAAMGEWLASAAVPPGWRAQWPADAPDLYNAWFRGRVHTHSPERIAWEGDLFDFLIDGYPAVLQAVDGQGKEDVKTVFGELHRLIEDMDLRRWFLAWEPAPMPLEVIVRSTGGAAARRRWLKVFSEPKNGLFSPRPGKEGVVPTDKMQLLAAWMTGHPPPFHDDYFAARKATLILRPPAGPAGLSLGVRSSRFSVMVLAVPLVEEFFFRGLVNLWTAPRGLTGELWVAFWALHIVMDLAVAHRTVRRRLPGARGAALWAPVLRNALWMLFLQSLGTAAIWGGSRGGGLAGAIVAHMGVNASFWLAHRLGFLKNLGETYMSLSGPGGNKPGSEPPPDSGVRPSSPARALPQPANPQSGSGPVRAVPDAKTPRHAMSLWISRHKKELASYFTELSPLLGAGLAETSPEWESEKESAAGFEAELKALRALSRTPRPEEGLGEALRLLDVMTDLWRAGKRAGRDEEGLKRLLGEWVEVTEALWDGTVWWEGNMGWRRLSQAPPGAVPPVERDLAAFIEHVEGVFTWVIPLHAGFAPRNASSESPTTPWLPWETVWAAAENDKLAMGDYWGSRFEDQRSGLSHPLSFHRLDQNEAWLRADGHYQRLVGRTPTIPELETVKDLINKGVSLPEAARRVRAAVREDAMLLMKSKARPSLLQSWIGHEPEVLYRFSQGGELAESILLELEDSRRQAIREVETGGKGLSNEALRLKQADASKPFLDKQRGLMRSLPIDSSPELDADGTTPWLRAIAVALLAVPLFLSPGFSGGGHLLMMAALHPSAGAPWYPLVIFSALVGIVYSWGSPESTTPDGRTPTPDPASRPRMLMEVAEAMDAMRERYGVPFVREAEEDAGLERSIWESGGPRNVSTLPSKLPMRRSLSRRILFLTWLSHGRWDLLLDYLRHLRDSGGPPALEPSDADLLARALLDPALLPRLPPEIRSNDLSFAIALLELRARVGGSGSLDESACRTYAATLGDLLAPEKGSLWIDDLELVEPGEADALALAYWLTFEPAKRPPFAPEYSRFRWGLKLPLEVLDRERHMDEPFDRPSEGLPLTERTIADLLKLNPEDVLGSLLKDLDRRGIPVSPYSGGGDLLDGRYRLREKLAENGDTQVWRADDALSPGRDAVIKLANAAGTQGLMLMREYALNRRFLARDRDPRVADVFSAGLLRSAEGVRIYVAMEDAGRATLSDLLAAMSSSGDDGAESSLKKAVDFFPPEYALKAARWVYEVQAWYESRGLLHRDFNAKNIAIDPARPFDPDGWKLLDFGAAVKRPEDAMNWPPDVIIGKPNAIAPPVYVEARYSPSTELWSGDVLLQQLFTGRHPLDPPAGRTLLQVSRNLRFVKTTLAKSWPSLTPDDAGRIVKAYAARGLDIPLTMKALAKIYLSKGLAAPSDADIQKIDAAFRSVEPDFMEPWPGIPAKAAAVIRDQISAPEGDISGILWTLAASIRSPRPLEELRPDLPPALARAVADGLGETHLYKTPLEALKALPAAAAAEAGKDALDIPIEVVPFNEAPDELEEPTTLPNLKQTGLAHILSTMDDTPSGGSRRWMKGRVLVVDPSAEFRPLYPLSADKNAASFVVVKSMSEALTALRDAAKNGAPHDILVLGAGLDRDAATGMHEIFQETFPALPILRADATAGQAISFSDFVPGPKGPGKGILPWWDALLSRITNPGFRELVENTAIPLGEELVFTFLPLLMGGVPVLALFKGAFVAAHSIHLRGPPTLKEFVSVFAAPVVVAAGSAFLLGPTPRDSVANAFFLHVLVNSAVGLLNIILDWKGRPAFLRKAVMLSTIQPTETGYSHHVAGSGRATPRQAPFRGDWDALRRQHLSLLVPPPVRIGRLYDETRAREDKAAGGALARSRQLWEERIKGGQRNLFEGARGPAMRLDPPSGDPRTVLESWSGGDMDAFRLRLKASVNARLEALRWEHDSLPERVEQIYTQMALIAMTAPGDQFDREMVESLLAALPAHLTLLDSAGAAELERAGLAAFHRTQAWAFRLESAAAILENERRAAVIEVSAPMALGEKPANGSEETLAALLGNASRHLQREARGSLLFTVFDPQGKLDGVQKRSILNNLLAHAHLDDLDEARLKSALAQGSLQVLVARKENGLIGGSGRIDSALLKKKAGLEGRDAVIFALNAEHWDVRDVLLMLAGGLVSDATKGIHEGLRRLLFVAIQA